METGTLRWNTGEYGPEIWHQQRQGRCKLDTVKTPDASTFQCSIATSAHCDVSLYRVTTTRVTHTNTTNCCLGYGGGGGGWWRRGGGESSVAFAAETSSRAIASLPALLQCLLAAGSMQPALLPKTHVHFARTEFPTAVRRRSI
jgi:hypothetical protein